MMKDQDKQALILLGSTGSIGTSALDVAETFDIPVDCISANRSVDLAEAQARKFRVRACAMADEHAAAALRIKLADTAVQVYGGEDGILQMIDDSPASVALNATVGKAGLLPTVRVLQHGKQLALANKESLVVAGELVMALAAQKGIDIRPVDSEHCAIAQCLQAGRSEEVSRILLTASGGPFFGRTRNELEGVSVKEALAHPTWNMGAKITIDSATMMNKGFEIIEAAHLFHVAESAIEVIVHRESIIHSMVEYIDGSVMAQIARPDMRLCIQHALTAPQRVAGRVSPPDFKTISTMSFYPPDEQTFVPLRLARAAIRAGGATAAVLNAANEVAVAAFLADSIRLTDIFDMLEWVTDRLACAKNVHTLEDILAYDKQARDLAQEWIANIKH